MMRPIVSSMLLCALAGAALAQDLPDGYGVVTPSGSTFTTEITVADSDDYIFQGFPGMTLSAVVKAGKTSTFQPDLQVLRPGGAAVGDSDGLVLTAASKSLKARLVLNATGWWKVRVRGAALVTDEFGRVTSRSTGAYSISIQYSSAPMPPLPAASKSFGATASISPKGNADDFPFQGYADQSFTGTLTVAKTSLLDPVITLVRPDGSVAAAAGQTGHEKKLTISKALDAAGTWRLHVIGKAATPPVAGQPAPDPTTGAYSVSVKLGKPPAPGLTPDGNHQYRLAVPAVGGATIGYNLTFKVAVGGTAPRFNSFLDPTGATVPDFTGGTTVKKFLLAKGMPIGDYIALFDAPAGPQPTNVTFARSLTPPKPAKKIVATLSKDEPIVLLNGVSPAVGGSTSPTQISVGTNGKLVDPNNLDASQVKVFIDHVALDGVAILDSKVQATVPGGLALGLHDVVVQSTTGQVAVSTGSFEVVPPPRLDSIDPSVGSVAGGYPLSITGLGFLKLADPQIVIDTLSGIVPVQIKSVTDTKIDFIAPNYGAAGKVTFGVVDNRNGSNGGLLPLNSFEFVSSASISRLVPSLIPVLGNEVVTIQGAFFASTDHVYLETAPGSGVFTDLSLSQTTFVDSNRHQFLAPVRGKGDYHVYVQDQFGTPNPPRTRILTYYTFTDIAVAAGIGSGTDKFDGWTNALGDYDADGKLDIFVARRGSPSDLTASATSMLRVLHNLGNGQFEDKTISVMPQTGTDDWRADRIYAADINSDGFADLELTTNTVAVPTKGMSHTRILMNEVRGGVGVGSTDRVFRDRTSDVMAPARLMQHYGAFGAPNDFYASDDWRGLDMWVGDIDKGGPGPPEIVITHDEVKNDDNPNADVFSSGVYCGNYCSSTNANSTFYAYTFYWGGSRLLKWDKSARGGLGRYKFDPNFFPRVSGPVVPQGNTPGGYTIPACSPHYSSICKGTFTPFVGQHLAVGTLDIDTKPDVAVLNNGVVTRVPGSHVSPSVNPVQISSLQVGINLFNAKAGSGITDVTDAVGNVGGDLSGDALAIGQPGFPDGNSYGVIAITKAAITSGGSDLRLIAFTPPALPKNIAEFVETTSESLAPADPKEHFQASQMQFIDIDQDGDQDLVLLANAPLGGTQAAFRVLRNERVGTQVGFMKRSLDQLSAGLVVGNEHAEGQGLSIGDVTGDGFLEFVITRAVPSGSGPQTRIVKTDH